MEIADEKCKCRLNNIIHGNCIDLIVDNSLHRNIKNKGTKMFMIIKLVCYMCVLIFNLFLNICAVFDTY